MAAERLADLLARPVLEVAPRLLGATLTLNGVSVRLTEVEAYDGANDPGSHAYRGRTARNAVMFGPAGHLYVYFAYGMHFCCNVACGPEGTASAVLLRAGRVIDGTDAAQARRRRDPGRRVPDRDLARGPARLCQALGIDRSCDGLDLAKRLVPSPVPLETSAISSGPRVGLRAAADRPWRFWQTGEPTVSRYVAAKPRRRATG
ncbi:MAG TPA: DNA-3-methyladenine glycosylase [Nocardioidaceae bacterium]|nr:DNA-3-methyladenine glycosylase [Nocardioidaceae bacterium]